MSGFYKYAQADQLDVVTDLELGIADVAKKRSAHCVVPPVGAGLEHVLV